MARGKVRVGVSGWRYQGWRKTFYPSELPQRRELEYLSARFDTVEINGSFYSLQRPESYQRWYTETPRGFVFAVKGSRYITHMKKLRDVEVPLANFFASGVLSLEEKLGPFLWQFPRTFPWDERFEAFLRLLPKTVREAERLAKKHDGRVAPFVAQRGPDRNLHHAVELRHPSFCDPAFIALLREHSIGLVVADAPDFPLFFDLTAPFVYVRLHGGEKIYESGYSPAQLDTWARRVNSGREGRQPRGVDLTAERAPSGQPRDVYFYFDNDAKVRAPYDAGELVLRIGK
jgi:uncharacterized protein YecE (DUF72 family)